MVLPVVTPSLMMGQCLNGMLGELEKPDVAFFSRPSQLLSVNTVRRLHSFRATTTPATHLKRL